MVKPKIGGGEVQVPEWWDAPFNYRRYDLEVCNRCAYSNKSCTTCICMYIHYTDRRRPCRAGYCVIEGVWKPKKRTRPETIEKIEKGFVIDGEFYRPPKKRNTAQKNTIQKDKG